MRCAFKGVIGIRGFGSAEAVRPAEAVRSTNNMTVDVLGGLEERVQKLLCNYGFAYDLPDARRSTEHSCCASAVLDQHLESIPLLLMSVTTDDAWVLTGRSGARDAELSSTSMFLWPEGVCVPNWCRDCAASPARSHRRMLMWCCCRRCVRLLRNGALEQGRRCPLRICPP